MKDDKTRLQLSISPMMRDWLESQAELRGQPMASVATHMLADVMLEGDKSLTALKNVQK
jgi:hypothetical protein